MQGMAAAASPDVGNGAQHAATAAPLKVAKVYRKRPLVARPPMLRSAAIAAGVDQAAVLELQQRATERRSLLHLAQSRLDRAYLAQEELRTRVFKVWSQRRTVRARSSPLASIAASPLAPTWGEPTFAQVRPMIERQDLLGISPSQWDSLFSSAALGPEEMGGAAAAVHELLVGPSEEAAAGAADAALHLSSAPELGPPFRCRTCGDVSCSTLEDFA